MAKGEELEVKARLLLAAQASGWRQSLAHCADAVAATYLDLLLHSVLPASDQISFLVEFRSLLWRRMHDMAWKDVPLVYRDLFGLLAALEATTKEHDPLDLLRLVDRGLLLGGLGTMPILQEMAAAVECKEETAANPIPIPIPIPIPSSRGQKQRRYQIPLPLPSAVYRNVPRFSNISVQEFYEEIFLQKRAALLPRVDWLALQRWRRLDYLLRHLGPRLLPVEIGQSYLSSEAKGSLMIGRDLLSRLVLPGAEVCYLAQHALFDQVPALRGDFTVPDFCCCLGEEDEESATDEEDASQVICNAWLGPCFTVSPLHHDCFHNILSQAVGYKYVRLYAAEEEERLYPLPGKMSNNSEVDLLGDLDSFPLFQTAPFEDAVLGPGDLLFIPRHAWHFVMAVDRETAEDFWRSRGLHHLSQSGPPPEKDEKKEGEAEFSFSINFWWGRRIIKHCPPH